MQKKITATDAVCEELSAEYVAMAADEAREAEASDFTEALLSDVADEPKGDDWLPAALRKGTGWSATRSGQQHKQSRTGPVSQ